MKTKWPKTGFEEFVKQSKLVEHTHAEWEKIVYGEFKPRPVCASCHGGICINKCDYLHGKK